MQGNEEAGVSELKIVPLDASPAMGNSHSYGGEEPILNKEAQNNLYQSTSSPELSYSLEEKVYALERNRNSTDSDEALIPARPWYSYQSIKGFLYDYRYTILKILIFVACFAALGATIGKLVKTGKLARFFEKIRDLGIWGLVIIGSGYLIACWPVPSLYTMLAFVGGFIYGFWKATIACTIGATLGFTYVFFISRYFLRNRVDQMIAKNPLFGNIMIMVEERAFQLIALLRVTPVPGFGLTNILLGAGRVSFPVYFVASFFPTMFELGLICYIGTTLSNIQDAVSGHAKLTPGEITLLVLEITFCIVIVVVFIWIGKRAVKKMKEAEAQREAEKNILGEQALTQSIDDEVAVEIAMDSPKLGNTNNKKIEYPVISLEE